MEHRTNHRQGFTLLELLVVTAIIAVLLALLVSAVQAVRQAAARAGCLSQLRQLGVSTHQYHDSHGTLPPGVIRPYSLAFPDLYGPRTDPYPMMTWQTRLLPFIEQTVLWKVTVDAYSSDPTADYSPPHVGFTTPIRLFVCPADNATRVAVIGGRSRAPTSYVGVSGLNQFRRDGLLYLDSRHKLTDITDGTSTTLLAGERPHDIREDRIWFGGWYGGWATADRGGTCNAFMGVRESGVLSLLTASEACHDGPYSFSPGSVNDRCSAFHFWSLHPGGANFLFADGSARFLPYSAAKILPDLASRAGGEVVSPDW